VGNHGFGKATVLEKNPRFKGINGFGETHGLRSPRFYKNPQY